MFEDNNGLMMADNDPQQRNMATPAETILVVV